MIGERHFLGKDLREGKAIRGRGKELSDEVYENLAEALDKLPNGFPRTSSRVEMKILKKLFSKDEAALASQMNRNKETADAIAKRIGISPGEAISKLQKMADKGLLWDYNQEGDHVFRLAPFIVGIYESSNIDHELAHLVEEYLSTGGAEGIMRPQPAIHRVIPAQKAVKSEWILPYDDVKAILLKSKSFFLKDCICREQQKLLGNECSFPLRTCLSFSESESPTHEHSISKDEALAFLDKSEELGLVHTVSNVMEGIGYVCNCCGCCCGVLRGITDFGIENSVASANYFAVIEPKKCAGCGTCIERCQVGAIQEENGISIVDRARCIGCGLCVTGCPNGAAELQRKSDSDIVSPPADFGMWERRRLHNRGL
jgi:electron transport complex protein RnfB